MRLTVFDLDHTLLTVNSSFRFGCFLYRHRFFSFSKLIGCLMDYARHKWWGMSVHQIHDQTFRRLFQGRYLEEIDQHVEKFLTTSLSDMLYLPVVQRLREAQGAGEYVLILSSSPDFLVKEIAHRMEVGNWKSTVYASDHEGKLVGIKSVMSGEDKARYVIELVDHMQLDREDITVYSDSYLDLPLLRMAGNAIGVSPDIQLKRICRQNGWEIL